MPGLLYFLLGLATRLWLVWRRDRCVGGNHVMDLGRMWCSGRRWQRRLVQRPGMTDSDHSTQVGGSDAKLRASHAVEVK